MNKSAFWYWLNIASTLFAGLGFVVVFFDGVVLLSNRAAQAEFNARGQYINQSVQLNNVSQAIIRAAATAAVNNNDTKLGNLLTANGIRYQATADANGVQAAATAPSAGATAARRPANPPVAAAQPGRGAPQPAASAPPQPAKGP